ncbi:hypothetical protein [Enterococcus gallinarum]|uniref:Phage protein n=1 Tax=Enterococcus gallinarum TaxID=1353 RepID=A0ABD4HMQ6_ENTGA|nr:hypothetical protein [Enterococcus gallinarum]MBA0947961.1 hypothetical protein [Enterococcus gallinarum]MBA0961546.1 hypothetical protein [Enterococcus gallinarum]MBA0969459.1 hypothetical protein [Enterococcus gallinarum]MBA0972746.1 hypothetical protein [Enterococcus gallinarum]NVI96320.1 hypothetical protein [Enterococcus gallinarum]
MTVDKKEIVDLLQKLRYSLSTIEHVDIREIQLTIDQTISEIQDNRCEGIKISVALSKVVDKMNHSFAFNGLKLDKDLGATWDSLKELSDKSRTSERTAVSILKGLWGINS